MRTSLLSVAPYIFNVASLQNNLTCSPQQQAAPVNVQELQQVAAYQTLVVSTEYGHHAGQVVCGVQYGFRVQVPSRVQEGDHEGGEKEVCSFAVIRVLANFCELQQEIGQVVQGHDQAADPRALDPV